MRVLPALLFIPLAGCTGLTGNTIYVQTVAEEGCTVSRGLQSDASGEGNAEVDVLTQSGLGGGTGSLTRLLSSTADCKEDNQSIDE